jgi:hypothetical protein
MAGTGWGEIGALVVRHVAGQPPFIVILYVLGGVFALLMIVEGLRANFWPRIRATTPGDIEQAPAPAVRNAMADSATASIWHAGTSPALPTDSRPPRTSFTAQTLRPRKPLRAAAKPYTAPRPIIRRGDDKAG